MTEKIEEIMENFDFEKMHEVMKFLKWEWWNLKTTPTVEQLREAARKKLEDTATRKLGFHSGGFRTEYINDGDLHLSFVVTDWDTLLYSKLPHCHARNIP